MYERMEERTKFILKCIILIPLAILLVFFCWPRESGETEGAIFRNTVRERLASPLNIEICDIQDFVIQDGKETVRVVIFSDANDKKYSEYYMHYYQLQKNGTYELYQGGKGTSSGMLCQGVYDFPGIRIRGYEKSYNCYYVTDPAIKEFVVRYEYFWREDDGKLKTQVQKQAVTVEEGSQMFCLLDPWDMDFAPQIKEGTDHSVVYSASAYDWEGNLLFGSSEK